jgi:hypothetical protein
MRLLIRKRKKKSNQWRQGSSFDFRKKEAKKEKNFNFKQPSISGRVKMMRTDSYEESQRFLSQLEALANEDPETRINKRSIYYPSISAQMYYFLQDTKLSNQRMHHSALRGRKPINSPFSIVASQTAASIK